MADEALQKVSGGFILTEASWRLVYKLIAPESLPLTDLQGLRLLAAHVAEKEGKQPAGHFQTQRETILREAREILPAGAGQRQ